MHIPVIEISCLICDTTTRTLPHYPCRVCGTCAAKVSDKSERAPKFFNASIGGGFTAYYADSHQTETHPDHLYFIDSVRCYANEARFGGIVIQAPTDQPEQ